LIKVMEGVRVLEVAQFTFVPAAGAILADWGADVIKVEPPTGDPMRNVFGSLGIGDEMPNPAFALDNRGKRSVCLDLRDPDEREQLERLLASADVFISNLRPDALDKLDLEPYATVERHPHLVYCSVSGYGLHGEERNRPTYDIGAFWARLSAARLRELQADVVIPVPLHWQCHSPKRPLHGGHARSAYAPDTSRCPGRARKGPGQPAPARWTGTACRRQGEATGRRRAIESRSSQAMEVGSMVARGIRRGLI